MSAGDIRWTVSDSGNLVATVDSADAGWLYVQQHQPHSVHYALTDGGWSVDWARTSFVGRTADRVRVWVTMTVGTTWTKRCGTCGGRGEYVSANGPTSCDTCKGTGYRPGYRMTDHSTAQHVTQLSVTGWTVGPHARTLWGGGQNRDDVASVVDFRGSSWTASDVASLVGLWDRWHLNTMRPGCVHQVRPSGLSMSDALDSIPPCEETGYRWGSAWLAEELPLEARTELARLRDLDPGHVPDYV